jgi:hypothetical protein
MQQLTLPPNAHTPEEADYFVHLTSDHPSAAISTEFAHPTDLQTLKGQVVYAIKNINTTDPNPDLEPGILVGISSGSLKRHCLIEMPCEDPQTHSHVKTCRVWVDQELVRPLGTVMEDIVGEAILRVEGSARDNHRGIEFAAVTSMGASLLKSPLSGIWAWYFPPKPTRQLDGSVRFTNRPLDLNPRILRIADSETSPSTNGFTEEHRTLDALYLRREARELRLKRPESVEDFLLSSAMTVCDITGIRLRVEPFTCISDNPHTELITRFLAGGAIASG